MQPPTVKILSDHSSEKHVTFMTFTDVNNYIVLFPFLSAKDMQSCKFLFSVVIDILILMRLWFSGDMLTRAIPVIDRRGSAMTLDLM